MHNKFGIPEDVEKRIRERDIKCVYCSNLMFYPYDPSNRSDSATIEHFREDGPFYWKDGLKEEDLSICCGSCNSSRGRRKISDWFKSSYCKKRNINFNKVTKVVQDYILKYE